MSSVTIFSKSVLKNKKINKLKLLFRVFGRIIKNNSKLFFFCSILAILTAMINFSIGINGRNIIFNRGETFIESTIKEIDKEPTEEIKIDKIKKILDEKINKEEKERIINEIGENKTSLSKQKAKEIIKKAGEIGGEVWNKENFNFEFNFFGFKLFKKNNLDIWGFIFHFLALILVVKSTLSLIHYYLMNYTYDSIEKNLKKDLFRHFINAKYKNSSEISRNLITQFTSDLDAISYDIWFIPNRLIYVATFLGFLFSFDFNFGNEEIINWPFLGIALGLFAVLIISQIILFKKASKLSLVAKKRLEEDNKVIYERINSLEHIKSVSGEEYEEEKINKQLDSTFKKNKKALWYSTMFKVVPNYVIIPNIPIIFLALTLTLKFTPIVAKIGTAFLVGNFSFYYLAVRNLNSEVTKIVEALLTLEELSSSLIIVNESVKILNSENNLSKNNLNLIPFKNGDITFQNVLFAYPKRAQLDILQNFSFVFKKGKIYGIAGKNGIGKSTITKTTLKLYDIKEGKILIGDKNVKNIDTKSLHQNICYQTNRPAFFHLSIAENVFYPYHYEKKNYSKLISATKEVGICDFIKKLPKGFDTVLKEGGGDLSEGQKQQINAMKIFIHEYNIYILDEILSNVQPDLKAIILENIFTKIKGKTVLVIDHHYEIFKYVDEIHEFTGKRLIKMKKSEFVN